MEKDQIESNQHKPNLSLRAACLRWVRICFIEGGKKYFSDQLANLKNNMLIELKCCFAAEKKSSLSLLKGCLGSFVLKWFFFSPSEHITAWNEKSQ